MKRKYLSILKQAVKIILNTKPANSYFLNICIYIYIFIYMYKDC